MIKIPSKTITPLIIGTTERVEICKTFPPDLLIMFRIEKIEVLEVWDDFKNEVTELLDKNEKEVLFTNLQFNKFVFYFNLMAKFFLHHSDDKEKDIPYIKAVESFMHKYTKYRKLGPKQEEKIFWNAFPK